MSGLLERIRPERFREFALVVIILALIAFFGSQIPDFVSGLTFTRISTSVAVIAVLAVGQTLVVLTRNIDLSVGSIVGLVAYFVGTFLSRDQTMSPVLVVALSIGIGAGLGALNGLLVAYGRVPSIIATLGTLAIYRVALVEWSGSKTVTTANLPEWLLSLPRTALVSFGQLDIKVLPVVAVLVVVVFQLVLRYLPYGRRLFAIGSNPDAARVAGFPMQRDILWAYVLNGSLAGLAGFMYLVRFGNIDVTAGSGLELQVVAAVVVGGVNIFGGSGSMIGAFLGAILIDLLQQSIIRLPGISEFVRDAVLGVLILLAVASDKIILGRLRALAARARRRQEEERLHSDAAGGAAAGATGGARGGTSGGP
jgi:rhamnose transport system permease protein